MRNRYAAIAYAGRLSGESARKIHKRLYDETIRKGPAYADKLLLAYAIKTANRLAKTEPTADALFAALWDMKFREKSAKLANSEVRREAEKEKESVVEDYVEASRKAGKWLYLASRHGDCAKDHVAWQGRLYCDEKAPEDVLEYARKRGLHTLQWVMGSPAWLVSRPNCRHYFVAITKREAEGKSLKRLERKYKTKSKEGDRDFQTPRRAAIEEYEDRLRLLRALRRERTCQKLEKEIAKAELLLKKWKNAL